MSQPRPTSVRADIDAVTVRAIDLVVDANGDLDLWFATRVGALQGRGQALARFARRAGVDQPPPAGGSGVVALPAEDAVELCRAFCRLEPATVLAHLVDQERRVARGRPPPGMTRPRPGVVRSSGPGSTSPEPGT